VELAVSSADVLIRSSDSLIDMKMHPIQVRITRLDVDIAKSRAQYYKNRSLFLA
jgi:hypothetical protein